ncbi:MAG: acyclic terpene utilization AtuA family protein [Parachlamydiales bacterium]|jgi:hypothetical protein
MPLKIGNAQAFWGDDPAAAENLVRAFPDLDFLTMDYLSEVSLSILAIQKEHDPKSGYAKDFIDIISMLIPFWEKGSKVRVVTNAGGLNPFGCAEACFEVLKKICRKRKYTIGVVMGDDVLALLKNGESAQYKNLDNNAFISTVKDKLVTANAYLGAMSITDALNSGADIVITGRVADPSLTVGPCMHHYKWKWDDYDRIAGATIAGHLIECGTQVTGGISTDWLDLVDYFNIGFPVAEVENDGSCTITKDPMSGGAVTVETVKEQLLYEIGDPGNYISPDVRASFLNLKVQQEGVNRVKVAGAKGVEPPFTLKVSATYRAGFKAEGYLTIFGAEAIKKARRCGEVILAKLNKGGYAPEKFQAECLGTGECAPGTAPKTENSMYECVLRVAAADPDNAKIEKFTKEIASLVTCGPPGVTGYTSGRPHVRPVFGYWPCLVETDQIREEIKILEIMPCA